MALALRTMVIPTAADDTMYSYAGERPRREWVVHLQARLLWGGVGWGWGLGVCVCRGARSFMGAGGPGMQGCCRG